MLGNRVISLLALVGRLVVGLSGGALVGNTLASTSVEDARHNVVGEVVDQGKYNTVDSGDRQLGSVRGEAEENAGGEGNEEDDDKREH